MGTAPVFLFERPATSPIFVERPDIHVEKKKRGPVRKTGPQTVRFGGLVNEETTVD